MHTHLNTYLANLSAERGVSENTLAAYRYDLTQFLDFLHHEAVSMPSGITPGHVYGFLAGLRRKGLAPASLSRKTISLKLWLAWLCAEEVIQTDPSLAVDAPKTPIRLPTTLSLPEIERLLTAPAGVHAGRRPRPGDAGDDVRLRPARLGTGPFACRQR